MPALSTDCGLKTLRPQYVVAPNSISRILGQAPSLAGSLAGECLYNLPGGFSYPSPSLGIYEHTKKPADVGKFKAPTLRNVALTAPYMHDGSIATLEEVLDHYAAGGRTIASGPYAGRGHDNPNKDARMTGVALTAQNREDLLAFLPSLTDTEVIHEPRFASPG